MRPRGVAPLLLASATMLAGCTKSGPAPVEEPASVRFAFAGCAAVLRGPSHDGAASGPKPLAPAGPVCEVTEADRTVRVRVTPDDATVRVTWAGAAITPAVTRPDGAQLLAIELPREAGDGQLVVTAEKAASRSMFRLAVRRATVDPRLARARALRREGRAAEAVEAMPDPATIPEPLAGRAASLRARLDLASGRAEAAIAGLRAAMAIHRRDGRVSDEALDGMALVHTLLTQGRRHAEARAVLADMAAPLAAWDEGRAQIGYYRALLARDTGDLRGALRDLAEAEREALRLGINDVHRSARIVTAQLLPLFGRHDEARAILREEAAASREGEPPCRRAEILATLGWVELTAAEAIDTQAAPSAPRAPASEATRLFSEARAAYEERCPRPANLQNAHVDLALAALREGDLDRAERHVTSARGFGAPPAWIALWLHESRGPHRARPRPRRRRPRAVRRARRARPRGLRH
ncbi:MAG: hypothetical protein QM820_24345 [Minicystis sp.]